MSIPKWISLLALLCFFGAIVFLVRSRRNSSSSGDDSVASQKTPPPPAPDLPAPDPDEALSRFTYLPDGRVLLNASIALSKDLYQDTPERDLEIIAEIFENYRLAFGENPAGSTNSEIVPQLLGKNDKELILIDPQLPALSSDQKLLDRWGTPFLFHPLAATAMEIHSAGPDQTLWTEDDLTIDISKIELNLQL